MNFIRTCAAIALAGLQIQSEVVAETLLERGDYLVNAVMGCDGCHSTPNAPPGPSPGRFGGGPQTWDTPWYTVKGSNITPDPETGIGKWSDVDIKRLMREGMRPDGRPISTQMPFLSYKSMQERDLDAVIAFMKTVPPLRKESPAAILQGGPADRTDTGRRETFHGL